MADRALYRAYRPKLFSEVIGQEHITTTLKNQIKAGRPSHAYLFCGSRGTGKTTTAKILARAVSCLKPVDGEPCGVCEACLAAKGDCPDILEIDAASNTGVDGVRELIDQAQFAPLVLRYRVFIIDEVHMLSGSAFNALLKTLEEPPAHVLFILATTEPQKLPATVISRCQRFDFRRLSIRDICDRLKYVLKAEGASIEQEGLQLIARSADGGMRDALSLTDQCLAFCGKKLTTRDVYDVLGSMEQPFLFDLAEHILSGEAPQALAALDSVVRGGRSLAVFAGDLSAHFRALLLAKTCGDCADILDCTDDLMRRYRKQADAADEKQLSYAMDELLRAQGELRYFPAPRVLLESLLVRLCSPVDDKRLLALETRIAVLERQLAVLAAEGPRPAPVPSFTAAAVPAPTVEVREEEPTDEAPPWDEEFVPPAQPPQTEYEGEEDPAPAASPAPAAQKAPGTAPAGEAEKLWAEALRGIQQQNPMVYIYAKLGKAISLDGDVLTVQFSKNDENKYKTARAPKNHNVAQTELVRLRRGTELVYCMEQLTGDEELLKGLFGNRLTIE